jgi:hypothetical protein
VVTGSEATDSAAASATDERPIYGSTNAEWRR